MKTQKMLGVVVKAVDFHSGRIDIANKAKDFLYIGRSKIGELCTLLAKDGCDRPYVDFVLDGKVVVSFEATK